jgi:hypothetical protein
MINLKNKTKFKENISLKELPNLVPKEYLPKINLLFNKDIPKEPKTSDELLLARFATLKETDVQKYFYKEIQYLAVEATKKHKYNYLEAVKNDNGDAIVSKLTHNQRMAFYARKKAEGFKSGFPDLTILLYNNCISVRDTMYLELKKIDAPSSICLTENQLNWFLKLNNMGFDSYITNNPIFFRDVIIKNIQERLFM